MSSTHAADPIGAQLSEILFERVSAGTPAFTTSDVRDLLDVEYGLTVRDVVELSGEIDQNLRVDCTDGRSYVVKIAPDHVDQADVLWQCSLLEHLQVTAPDLPVPRLRRTTSGHMLATLQRGGRSNSVRVLSWLPGRVLGGLGQRSPALLRDIGAVAATLVGALADMSPRESAVSHHWDLLRAGESVRTCLPHVTDPALHDLIRRTMRRYEQAWPAMQTLPKAVIHQDLNDFNILVQPGVHRTHRISGVIDIGDAIHTIRIAELAVAIAYSMLQASDPLRAAAEVVHGYAAGAELLDAELAVLFPLATARLCVNAATWTRRLATTSNDYGLNRSRHTLPLLARLDLIPMPLAEATFRAAAGLPAWPAGTSASLGLAVCTEAGRTDVVTSRHLEPGAGHRPVRSRWRQGQPATLALGVGLDKRPGDPVRSPLPAGTVTVADAGRLVVRHDRSEAPVWAVWSGVTAGVGLGAAIEPDQQIGIAAVDPEQPAHAAVRIALVTGPELAEAPLPSPVQPWQREMWQALCPDPALLYDAVPTREAAETARHAVEIRERYVGRAQRHYYSEPMSLVSSDGVWLHDIDGLSYLDAINNVTHVGHADPTVVEAVDRQVRRLNTNSRFVYGELAAYARRLADLLPDPLSVVYFVCTGSEANDLALRMARQVTDRHDVMVIDGAYHGNTTAVIEISPDRYDGPGGGGRPLTTHPVPTPNRYRGEYGYDDRDAGARYAADAAAVLSRMLAESRPPAAFFSESLIGSAGQITLPPGYLASAFAAVREAGGLCVSDEVQIGFGRLGRTWGFQLHETVPDIVTLGKPMANGMPLGAVVTSPGIAAEFDRGMKYFNTFAGNPVCCAAGLAVLDVLERDQLQDRAADVGSYLLGQLHELQGRHELIGDVRGQGLYLGIELVRDPETKEPAGAEAQHVSERMREEGVVIYPNGRDANILKIKPPIIFGRAEADILTGALDAVLTETW